MVKSGRDGLLVKLESSADGWTLVIERDGGRRVEVWPTEEQALVRLAQLCKAWSTRPPPEEFDDNEPETSAGDTKPD